MSEPSENERQATRSIVPSLLRSSLILMGVQLLIGAVVAIATIDHAASEIWFGVAVAMIVIAHSMILPIWFKPLLRNGGNYQLAVVAWRMLTLLPALAWGMAQSGATRNSFLTALMACYFVMLPLESWLLVRDVNSTRPR